MTAEGALDRSALAQVVFADPNARRDLEAIVHPLVYARIEQWYSMLLAPIGIADIPLLFETGREGDFRLVVATWCPRDQQVARLHARGLSREEIDARLASQWPAGEKAARADFVIDTTGSEAETDRQVENILSELRRLSAG
jgi:dephospho-CoA kinase